MNCLIHYAKAVGLSLLPTRTRRQDHMLVKLLTRIFSSQSVKASFQKCGCKNREKRKTELIIIITKNMTIL